MRDRGVSVASVEAYGELAPWETSLPVVAIPEFGVEGCVEDSRATSEAFPACAPILGPLDATERISGSWGPVWASVVKVISRPCLKR